MKMKEYRDDYSSKCCYFHPRETVVGVCASCLNERLLVLASKQSPFHHTKHNLHTFYSVKKIFALTSFLNRIDLKQQKSDHQVCNDSSSVCSQEDSFISIKFEDNGVASWDKEKMTKIPLDQQCHEVSWNHIENWNKATKKKIKSVVEHVKPCATLRWRKRIGHIFHLIRWKRSNKANICHGTKLERAKVRYGWIRSLTKRRTKE